MLTQEQMSLIKIGAIMQHAQGNSEMKSSIDSKISVIRNAKEDLKNAKDACESYNEFFKNHASYLPNHAANLTKFMSESKNDINLETEKNSAPRR